jgi:hypothetical protein
MKKWILGYSITLVFLMICIFGCTGGKSAVKTEPAYLVDTYVGNVAVSHDNGNAWSPVSAGLALRQSDIIRTESNSFCDILMPKRGIFRISDNSEVSISRLVSNIESLTVNRGKISVNVSQKLADNESFRVETSSGVVAVRGTEFTVEDDGTNMTTEVKEGTVQVKPNVTVNAAADVRDLADQAVTLSVTSNQSLSLNASDNEKTGKELSDGLSKAKSVEEAKKFLDGYRQNYTRKVVKKSGSFDKSFDEIGKPERLQKVQNTPRVTEEEKKELDQSVKDIQAKTGQKGIASDKVEDRSTTREEDAAELASNVGKVQERTGQKGIAEKKVSDRATSKEQDMKDVGNVANDAQSRLKARKTIGSDSADSQSGSKMKSARDLLKKQTEDTGN